MKKTTTTVLILVIQFFLLIIFQNIYSLFKGFEAVDIQTLDNPAGLMENIKNIKNMFSVLFIVTSLFFLGTAVYLGLQYKKARHKPEAKGGIPPLQDYLLELKGSETQLKDLVVRQQANVVEKEELNKSIINNINSAVIFLNQAGRIDIFNAVAQQLFAQGFANAKNNLPEKVLSKFPEICEFLRKHENTKVSQEISSDERVFFVDLNPIENVGQLLLVKDITEEKKQEEIDRRNGNFIMLGEMTAFLAHEIRNSLGVIYGYTKTLQPPSDKIDKVNKEINFLSTMMESFLKFSRPVEVHKKPEIDAAELLGKIARENKLNLELSQEKMVVGSDPALLYSVFSNLLLNSREAGADRVEVSYKQKRNKDREIRLKDNGGGIDPELKEKIWLPFFTTKEKGTGMGLAMIRKIINSLNGEISLAESSAKGTTFKIVFYS